MTYVKARPGESVDDLLRRFKKAVENSGILSDLKKYEYYEKPSMKKKRKKIAARKRWLKQRRKIERFSKPKNENFKWNRDKTKKIPLKANFKDNNKKNFKPRSNNDQLRSEYRREDFNKGTRGKYPKTNT